MRISDWSSDVCSSDLRCVGRHGFALRCLGFGRARFISLCGNRRSGPGCKHEGRSRRKKKPIHDSSPSECLTTRNPCFPKRAWGRLVAKLLTRSEEHTSELQSLMRISYAVFCLKKKK